MALLSTEQLDTFLSETAESYGILQEFCDKAFVLDTKIKEQNDKITALVSEAIDSGAINGSNDDKRKAQARVIFSADFQIQGVLSVERAQLSNDIQACERKIDFQKLKLRVFEMKIIAGLTDGDELTPTDFSEKVS